jgi:dipeptidase E
MRLFLSSYRAGDHNEQLQSLFGKKAEVAVITNAKDYKSKEERQESVDEVLKFLRDIDFLTKEIDLRLFFDKPQQIEMELQKYSAVWLAGGNTFILKRALRQSGADEVLKHEVRNNNLAYGGESAGAILATPSLHGTEFGDDLTEVPEGYKKEIIWDGLNLVPFHIVPHYKSDWFGKESEEMVTYLQKKKLPHYTLMDSQVIVVDGNEEKFLK